jgi:hypothetical protein
MVGGVELVLDDDPMLLVARDDIGLERPDTLLGADKLQVQADGLAEQPEVVLLREPGREVARLVLPVVANAHRLQPAEGGLLHRHRRHLRRQRHIRTVPGRRRGARRRCLHVIQG